MSEKSPRGKRIVFDLEIWLSSLFIAIFRYSIKDPDAEGIAMISSPAIGHYVSKLIDWVSVEYKILRQQSKYEKNLEKHLKLLEKEEKTATPARKVEIEQEKAAFRKKLHDYKLEQLEFQKPDFKKK